MFIEKDAAAAAGRSAWYGRYMLLIAGLGGLLYGIDVGIIAGALPYLEATATTLWRLDAQQLGFIVAAVLLGSVLSSLFAGAVADVIGRKRAMVLAGLLFVASIPVIALADGYVPLLMGRLLQGISGGLIGVVVPLYLAECLDAQHRGRGTALFQLLLTVGLVVAALIGLHQARVVEEVASTGNAEAVFQAKDQAWRGIFWMCLPPGLAFTIGALLLGESPRWLRIRGREAQANKAMASDSLLSRRYVLPFLLACLILACNQATGINSILAYSVNIFERAGLPGSLANQGDVAIKLLNALMTVVAVFLVDRRGRKFLLMLGTGGIVVTLLTAGLLFRSAEQGGSDVSASFRQQLRTGSQELLIDPIELERLGLRMGTERGEQLVVSYACGEFVDVQTRRPDAAGTAPMRLSCDQAVRADSVIGRFFRQMHLNPFPDPQAATRMPLRIESARLIPLPAREHGVLVVLCVLAFVGFFAVGPGVCVWLALSELMPTRIRSNGMSVALLINQFVSTVLAAMFLPVVGQHGYASMFFLWAGCTLVYFLAAALLLPETKGKTLEEIEEHFARRTAA